MKQIVHPVKYGILVLCKGLLLISLVSASGGLVETATAQSFKSRSSSVLSRKTADRLSISTALESDALDRSQFEQLRNFILPSAKEAKWREIPWLPSLHQGRTMASQKKRPLFVWAMNGDPLGCV
jgi:hypothetical protein